MLPGVRAVVEVRRDQLPAEAGEVGHWSIVGRFAEKAGDVDLTELTDWALPIQKRHFDGVLAASLEIADEEDPEETG